MHPQMQAVERQAFYFRARPDLTKRYNQPAMQFGRPRGASPLNGLADAAGGDRAQIEQAIIATKGSTAR
jgi:hypothetical protein